MSAAPACDSTQQAKIGNIDLESNSSIIAKNGNFDLASSSPILAKIGYFDLESSSPILVKIENFNLDCPQTDVTATHYFFDQIGKPWDNTPCDVCALVNQYPNHTK